MKNEKQTTTDNKKPYVRHTREFYLYSPHKGFLLKNPKGMPTLGLGDSIMVFDSFSKAQFALEFFTKNVSIANNLVILTSATESFVPFGKKN